MSCFPCFRSHRPKRSNSRGMEHTSAPPVGQEMKKQRPADTNAAGVEVDISKIKAKSFTFRELATATKNFRQECLLGEGGFGRVYKGTLQSSGQVVAVKQLDRNGTQGQKEFLGEILALSLLHHPNLVNLIGYCADGDQRLLVHEFIPGGTLEDRVLDNASGKMPLDWYTRIKIAYGTALGLEYLHEKANTPVIYRDLKASNILLDEEFNPKLSDVGLGRLGHDRDMMHGPSRLMGTYGFCAPEYSRTCEVTMKSDVYSYGVILLELITGRRAIDTTRANDEQNLVSWAQPLFRDPKKFPDMADPLLNKQFPEKDLNQAVAITAMCLQEEASARPFMSDVVTTLSFLSTSPPPPPGSIPTPVPADQNQDCNADSGSECVSEDDESNGQASDNESCSDNNHRDGSDNERNGQDLRQGDGEESKEWHSFERDESGSPGDQKSTSNLRNNGDQNNNSTQDNYGSTVPSRSSSGESNDECVSKSNSKVTEKKESTAVALDSGVSSTASSHQPIIKGYSKSLNYLDRTTSRRA